MSEEDTETAKEVVRTTFKLIGDGYTKVSGILRKKVCLGEIRGFMAGILIEEKDADFEMFISTVKEIRKIIKSDRHE